MTLLLPSRSRRLPRGLIRFVPEALGLLVLGSMTAAAVCVASLMRQPDWFSSPRPGGPYYCMSNNGSAEVGTVIGGNSRTPVRDAVALFPQPSGVQQGDRFVVYGEWGTPCSPWPDPWWDECSQALPLTADMRTVERVGFPWRAAWTITDSGIGGAMPVDHAMARLGRVRIPLGIRWYGLAADSLFFAGVWLLAMFVPYRIRWLLRRRRGACTRCGYDLKGLPTDATCPECGQKRAK